MIAVFTEGKGVGAAPTELHFYCRRWAAGYIAPLARLEEEPDAYVSTFSGSAHLLGALA